MDAVTTILLLHAAATWYLVGLIWFVQVNHYPLFDRVGEAEFPRYEADHQRLTTPVVLPPMVVELGTSCYLALFPLSNLQVLGYVGFALVVMIWASTFLIQVPLHTKVGNGFDRKSYLLLVRTNWLRTVAWSLRGLLALWMLTEPPA